VREGKDGNDQALWLAAAGSNGFNGEGMTVIASSEWLDANNFFYPAPIMMPAVH
jgi:hypothetical protein